MNSLPSILTAVEFFQFTAFLFLGVFGRYIFSAGVFYVYFFMWKKSKFEHQHLSKKPRRENQIRKEIFWSALASFIFAIFGTATYLLWQNGFTSIYLDINQYGFWYLPISLLLIAFLHDTMYYWSHRWMHKPNVYKIMHKVHHDSLVTTPWTAFSFHPSESILAALMLPILLLIVPIHPIVLAIYLTVMTVSSIINHLDIELYPKNSSVHSFLIGATHHHYHHDEFQTNFGLYFTFWDKFMKTESER